MSASPSPRGSAGASAPQSRHPYTDNIRPYPLEDMQRIFAEGPRLDFRPARHVVTQSFADQLAETVRQPVTAYLLGMVSGASVTVIAAMLWAGVLV